MTMCYGRVEEESSSLRPAQEVIASNDDLLTELLLRLPIKSLLKFKSVCKHWRSLVSDPRFIHRRNMESKSVSALYFACRSLDTNRLYYEFAPLQNDPLQTMVRFADSPACIVIKQSCKGLFLCRSVGEDKYLVYNPTTNQFKTLPPLPLPRSAADHVKILGLSLAFDPSTSHSYRVVCSLRDHSNPANCCQILIYSSETGCWRVSGAPFDRALMPYSDPGVYSNGALHWCSGMYDDSLYFDLDEEIVGEVPMPLPLDEESPHVDLRYFGESSGHLHLVYSLAIHLDIYEMEHDRSGWFLKFRVDRDVLARVTMQYERGSLMSILHLDRGEKEEDSFLVMNISKYMVIRYNLVSQAHHKIYEMDSRPEFVSRIAYQYIESLSLA